MAHYIGYELIEALVERPFDHERDMRNILCPHPGCEEYEDHAWLCDKGCDRHAENIVELPSGETRMVCSKCVQERLCENCEKSFPRWQLSNGFCSCCASVCRTVEAGESW